LEQIDYMRSAISGFRGDALRCITDDGGPEEAERLPHRRCYEPDPALTRRCSAPVVGREGGRYTVGSSRVRSMPGFVQLDLFGDRLDLARPSNGAPAKPIAPKACPMAT